MRLWRMGDWSNAADPAIRTLEFTMGDPRWSDLLLVESVSFVNYSYDVTNIYVLPRGPLYPWLVVGAIDADLHTVDVIYRCAQTTTARILRVSENCHLGKFRGHTKVLQAEKFARSRQKRD
jgi:hypothetical protein